ncbi:DDE_3 domain-containing protein [Trichonephila clavipes]|nr:DDE_3 domain-containing protein [Trichonephila clavipes]
MTPFIPKKSAMWPELCCMPLAPFHLFSPALVIRRQQQQPEFNNIEHVWDALRRRVAALNPPPQTIATLSTAFEKQRLALHIELLDHNIESITHHCMCCIASQGDHMPY